MKTYLVGGALRDRLLGLEVRERDWVVVGATADQLTKQGYKEVGRSFPVFLHPQTKEEYALARRETKTAPGYRGFEVDFGPEVTLEEDLARRDLTINSMAEDAGGRLIDPYGGERDLGERTLRHVSPAFREDPVRILRVARFAARFAGLGFEIAPETMALMAEMVTAGEAAALVPERVWQETLRALETDAPQRFFEALRECGALKVIFPEIDRLWGVPQPERWHPEIDTGVHVMMVLEQVARFSPKLEVRFAALTHDLGKGVTPEKYWPRHSGHEAASVRLVGEMCERLGAPKAVSRPGRESRAPAWSLPSRRRTAPRDQAQGAGIAWRLPVGQSAGGLPGGVRSRLSRPQGHDRGRVPGRRRAAPGVPRRRHDLRGRTGRRGL